MLRCMFSDDLTDEFCKLQLFIQLLCFNFPGIKLN